MAITNKLVFTALTIIAWIIFAGLSIEAGGLLVNFVFTLAKPEVIDRLYQKLDLSGLFQQSPGVFFMLYGFILTIAILKAVLFYAVVMLVTKLDLRKPFSIFVSKQIMKISLLTLTIGVLSVMAKKIAENLLSPGEKTANLSQFWADSEGFILMAAVIYIIATIFKRGMELQTENELTV